VTEVTVTCGLEKIVAIGLDERAWDDGAAMGDGRDDAQY
jgi:hypothetical protein